MRQYNDFKHSGESRSFWEARTGWGSGALDSNTYPVALPQLSAGTGCEICGPKFKPGGKPSMI